MNTKTETRHNNRIVKPSIPGPVHHTWLIHLKHIGQQVHLRAVGVHQSLFSGKRVVGLLRHEKNELSSSSMPFYLVSNAITHLV